MKTTLVRWSGAAGPGRSSGSSVDTLATCSTISPADRCRVNPNCPVAQNVHPMAQPAWLEMHTVARPLPSGGLTLRPPDPQPSGGLTLRPPDPHPSGGPTLRPPGPPPPRGPTLRAPAPGPPALRGPNLEAPGPPALRGPNLEAPGPPAPRGPNLEAPGPPALRAAPLPLLVGAGAGRRVQHQDRLDRVAPGQAEQELVGPAVVAGLVLVEDQPGPGEPLRQSRPQRPGQVGHGPRVGLAPPVQPVDQLAGPVGRLAGLGHQRLQLTVVKVVQGAGHGA